VDVPKRELACTSAREGRELPRLVLRNKKERNLSCSMTYIAILCPPTQKIKIK
jgi:hypothetical protein